MQGKGHFVHGNRQMEDANVDRDIGHLKDFFFKEKSDELQSSASVFTIKKNFH